MDVLRKHRVQLSQQEIAYTETLVHSISGWNTDGGLIHASKRGRIFSHAEVLDALKTGRVIEVNSFGRVLVRSAKGICVVASIRDRRVITIWFNRPSDKHKTLDLAAYTWKIDAAAYVKSLGGQNDKTN